MGTRNPCPVTGFDCLSCDGIPCRLRASALFLPEPCTGRRCYSPTACNGWGYCRERNDGRAPTTAEVAARRARAAENRSKEVA